MFVAGFSLATFLLSTFACNGKGGTLASVDGETITMEEFAAYLQNKPDVRVVTENGTAVLPVDGTLGFQALQDLVGQKMLLKLAKADGVLPTKDEIAKEIEFKKKLQPNFIQSLTQRGLSFEQIGQAVTLDLAKERLQTKGVSVSDADVEAYIKANPGEFIDHARVEMMWIYVKTEAAQQTVDKELGSGQGFGSVATRYSESPTAKETGGKFLDPRGRAPELRSLPPILLQAVNSTPEQRSTGWVKVRDGWAKFYVERKTEDKPITVTDVMRQAYKRKIAIDRGRSLEEVQTRILEELKKAKIKVEPKAYRDAWKEAFDKFVSQNRADMGTSATGQ